LTSASDDRGADEAVPGSAPECPTPKRDVWRGGDPADHAVAITFDDGPSAQTRAILRALRRNRAKATFFLVGREIPGREAVLRRASREGHELGNHSTTHSALPSKADIATTSNLIARTTGHRPCVFRPPEGKTSHQLLRDVRQLGMTTVAWDVDSGDWASQLPAAIRGRALATVRDGSIILMHDGGGERAGTARALSAVIDSLRKDGYQLGTVSELLRDAPTLKPPDR
jgi:peptidoglycan/xylan/chitin deacetylase (PgdA/CDA1 family)